MSNTDAKTGRTIHETVSHKGHNKPRYDIVTVLKEVMTNAASEGKRQSTMTLWMYEDGANYGKADLRKIFQPNFDRTKWMDDRLSIISPDFAKALKLVETYKEDEKRAKTAIAKVNLVMNRNEARKKVNAARAMCTNALKACLALREINPLTVTLNKWGFIEVTDHKRDPETNVVIKDDDGNKVVEEAEFAGRKLVERGNEVLGLSHPAKGSAQPKSEAPGEVARLNKGVLETARKAVEIATASDAKLAPEIVEEQDALLITLLRARFVQAGRINDKALHDWFAAHNKVSTGNGKPSMPHVATVENGKAEDAKAAASAPKPRTARGS